MPPTAYGQAGQAAEQANLSPLSFPLSLSSSLPLLVKLSLLSLLRFLLSVSCQLNPSSYSFPSPRRSNSVKPRVSVLLSSRLYFSSLPRSSVFLLSAHSLRDFSRYRTLIFSFFFLPSVLTALNLVRFFSRNRGRGRGSRYGISRAFLRQVFTSLSLLAIRFDSFFLSFSALFLRYPLLLVL